MHRWLFPIITLGACVSAEPLPARVCDEHRACPDEFECTPEGWCVRGGLGNPVWVQQVYVPEGSFYMGCNEARDGRCLESEYRQHEVHVPAFAIDRTEATEEMWRHSLPSTSEGRSFGPDHPVYGVSWSEARRYCENRGMRLPTEAEWEKAARGGCALYDGDCASAMPRFPWGDASASCERATRRGCATRSVPHEVDDGVFIELVQPTTAPVGSTPDGASPYGALDMAGNIMEWTADCWFSSYTPVTLPARDGTGSSVTTEPPTDGSAWEHPPPVPACRVHVVRGGGYAQEGVRVRASSRARADRHQTSWSAATGGLSTRAGVRCAMDL